MARFSTIYVCQNCGAKTSKWQGKCNDCGAWNSLVEEVVQSSKGAAAKGAALKPRRATGGEAFGETKPLMAQTQDQRLNAQRIPSGFAELDRVLGGEGFVPGSLLLFGGEPGIGKS